MDRNKQGTIDDAVLHNVNCTAEIDMVNTTNIDVSTLTEDITLQTSTNTTNLTIITYIFQNQLINTVAHPPTPKDANNKNKQLFYC